MSRAVVLVTVLGLGPAVLGAQSLPPASIVSRQVDSLAQDWIASHGSPGVSIEVTRDGGVLVSGGWGFADLENDVRATARTVYEIGSITKQFTAAAVMQEVEQGRIKLDDSIGTYLPSLPDAWKRVTVRQLLNHTSGVPSYTSLGQSWIRRWGEVMPPDTLVALTAAKPLDFEPGTKWSYDNSGYVILGMLIEKVTGTSWADNIRTRFTEPLGLPDTRWCDVRRIIPRRARGYDPDGDGFKNAAFLEMSQPYAAGALCSTVVDLARWDQLLHGGKVVSAASYTAMTTPEGAAAQGRIRYGFALSRGEIGGHTMISHNGGISGFISANAWFPDSRTSVTVLTNTGSNNPAGLFRKVAMVALGIPLPPAPQRVTLTAAERARYVGEYDLAAPGGTRQLSITEKGDALVAQLHVPGQAPFELIPYGNDSFGIPFTEGASLTFTVESGRATAVTFQQGDNKMQGKRRP